MKNNGFTMLEVLVVVIIIGILAILAVPSTREPVERSRAKRAEFNLLTIYSAQKRYFLAKRLYFVCDNITDPDDRLTAINSNLSIKIDDPYFITPSIVLIQKRRIGHGQRGQKVNAVICQ